MATKLELFIEESMVYSDDSLRVCIPKIKRYLSKDKIKLIDDFVKQQESLGVNFSFEDSRVDIVGIVTGKQIGRAHV